MERISISESSPEAIVPLKQGWGQAAPWNVGAGKKDLLPGCGRGHVPAFVLILIKASGSLKKVNWGAAWWCAGVLSVILLA